MSGAWICRCFTQISSRVKASRGEAVVLTCTDSDAALRAMLPAYPQARDWLDERLSPAQTLLFVSHHAEEVPRTVDRLLRLDRGQVVERR